MVDSGKAIREILLLNSSVTSLLQTDQNSNPAIYVGNDLPEHFDPNFGPAILISRRGGQSHAEITALANTRVQIKVAAGVEKYLLAFQVYQALFTILQGVNQTGMDGGTTLINSITETTAAQEMSDPDTGWCYVIGFWNILATDVTAVGPAGGTYSPDSTVFATTASMTVAIAVETTRAEAAEAALQAEINGLSAPSGTANEVYATPNGSSGTASLRALVAADIPALPYDASGAAATAQATAESFATAAVATEVTNRNTAIAVETTRAEAAEALLAPLASPALTGTPTAPTKSALTNNTDIATTAYADAAVAVEVTNRNSAIAVETSRAEAAEALLAPLASPALTGTPTAPTKAAFNNSTDIATTAYVDDLLKGVDITGFRDDFLCGSAGITLTTGGNVLFVSDSGAWEGFGITASGAVTGSNPGTFANPGIASLTSASAASTDGATLCKGSGGSASMGALGSNAGWEANFVIQVGSIASIAFRVGFMLGGQQEAATPTDGIWIEFDTANANSNADFTWVTAKASAVNYSTTNSVAVAANQFYHLRIRSTSAGTILFSVNGGTEASISTDVPTGVLQLFLQVFTRTTAAKTLQIDFVSYMAATGRT